MSETCMPFHLINSEKINLVATTTCDFMQRSDSAICFLWLESISTQKDATWRHTSPLEGLSKDQTSIMSEQTLDFASQV